VIGLIGNLASFAPSQQTETEVSKQTSALLCHGAEGRAVLHDIDVYLQGITAYRAAHNAGSPFTRTDITRSTPGPRRCSGRSCASG
jgi:hypothetical protein